MAGEALSYVGYHAPHASFRGVAFVGSSLLFFLWFSMQLLLGILGAVLPVHATGQYVATTYRSALVRWEQLLQPVPAYQQPPSARRQPSHRKRYASWAAELLDRAAAHKPQTASVRRHFQRYVTSYQEHQAAIVKHHAAIIATGLSLGAVYPLLLLLLVCFRVAQAVAALRTNLSPLPSLRVQPQQWQQSEAMLVRTQQAFTYSVMALPGCTGAEVAIQLVHDHPITSKPRTYLDYRAITAARPAAVCARAA